mgnify:CR=1 FL=1|tara:strand:- start:3405 stop:3956 length:552 start_codon:yes stop_codon:yes gene_type:complete
MSCTINKGRLEPCKDSVGGIQAVYFVDYGTLGDIEYESATSSEIKNVAGVAAVAPTAFKYVLKGASSLEQTVTSSRENGTTFYDQLVNLTFKKLSVQSHDEVALIAVARPHVIVEDNNGNAFLVGTEWGADVNGGTIVTGAAMGDLSGYTLTLQGMEKKPANFLSGGVTGVGITISTTNITDI